MPDRKKFTLKESDHIIYDKLHAYFGEQDASNDMRELLNTQVPSEQDTTVLPGYHIMPDGSLMPNEEMPQQ